MEGGVEVERSWSKKLFGNQHMLQVTSWIGQGGAEFTAPQVEGATGLSASSVHRLLGILCVVGLLARVPRTDNQRIQTYRRERQPFWRAMRQIQENARSSETSRTSERGA